MSPFDAGLHAGDAGIADLQREVRRLQAQMERLLALQRDHAGALSRLAQLEAVLDVDRVVSHGRAAIKRAAVAAAPIPHLVVGQLFPPQVHDALIGAIPADLFFDDGAKGRRELAVPLTLAPIDAVVTWTFVSDVLRTDLATEIALRLDAAPSHGSRGRIQQRRAGDVLWIGGSEKRVVRVIVPLITAGDVEVAVGTSAGAHTIAVSQSSAVAFLATAGIATLASAPSTASGVVHTYEFPITLSAAPN